MKKSILMVVLMGGCAAFAQNNILSVSPSQVSPGTSGVTVTFTVPDTTPPTPPLNVIPIAVSVGTVSGTGITRVDFETVTAVFDFSSAAEGLYDCSVSFPTPNGTLTFIMNDGFTMGTPPPPAPPTVITNNQPMATTYPLVDTAQVEFYDDSSSINSPSNGEAFFGQDGSYAGRQPDYTISGDGLTVQDNVTGLIWTQSHDWDDSGVLDADDKMTQAAAAAYVATLNAANYGGYSDWRLPSIKEIYSLMDFNGTDPDTAATDSSGLTPFINTNAFTIGYGDTAAGERIIDSQFAVSTIYVDTVMGGEEAMFGLNLVDGRIKGYPTQTGKIYYAYYCRGNPAYGLNDFEDNTDGTINDNATGLMWAQADSLIGMDWETALNHAETNMLGGHSDWRLPNAKELQSLVDYTRSPGTTGSAAIDPLFNATPITNMAGDTDFPWYWSGTTHLKFTGSAASGVYVCFGRGTGSMDSGVTIIDVHGAGCQRSDPKSGDPADYPNAGNGPQGDVQRVFNFVRLVRDIDVPADTDGDGMLDANEVFVGSDPSNPDSVMAVTMEVQSSGQVEISWPVFKSGLRYNLYGRTNLVEGAWTYYGTTTSSNLTRSVTSDAIFYKLEINTND